jgi:hypothetical protein
VEEAAKRERQDSAPQTLADQAVNAGDAEGRLVVPQREAELRNASRKGGLAYSEGPPGSSNAGERSE